MNAPASSARAEEFHAEFEAWGPAHSEQVKDTNFLRGSTLHDEGVAVHVEEDGSEAVYWFSTDAEARTWTDSRVPRAGSDFPPYHGEGRCQPRRGG